MGLVPSDKDLSGKNIPLKSCLDKVQTPGLINECISRPSGDVCTVELLVFELPSADLPSSQFYHNASLQAFENRP
jgi:hypothetical protein